MKTTRWNDASLVREVPFGAEAAACLLRLEAGAWHFAPALLERWLAPESPFARRGTAAVLHVEGVAAVLVAHDPRMADGGVAVFAALRLNEGLSAAEKTHLACILLEAARRWGKLRGADKLRGPLFLSTWHPYRVLADDRGDHPEGFPGEGVEPVHFNAWYRAAGLEVTDRYVTMAPPEDPDYWRHHLNREAGIAERRAGPLDVRSLAPEDGLRLLPQIHGWLNSTFVHNPYFVALDGAEFAERVLAAFPGEVEPIRLGAFDRQGAIRGVLTGHVAEGRGVLKTIAVHPETRGSRCAMALTFTFHRILFERGVTRVWHALMHEENSSARMSAKYAQPVRHYVLYGTDLA